MELTSPLSLCEDCCNGEELLLGWRRKLMMFLAMMDVW